MKCFTVIVENQFTQGDEAELFMNASIHPQDEITYLKPPVDMLDVLVLGGFFTSKSQAQKAGWPRELPTGYNEWQIGKLKRWLYLFNPDERNIPMDLLRRY